MSDDLDGPMPTIGEQIEQNAVAITVNMQIAVESALRKCMVFSSGQMVGWDFGSQKSEHLARVCAAHESFQKAEAHRRTSLRPPQKLPTPQVNVQLPGKSVAGAPPAAIPPIPIDPGAGSGEQVGSGDPTPIMHSSGKIVSDGP